MGRANRVSKNRVCQSIAYLRSMCNFPASMCLISSFTNRPTAAEAFRAALSDIFPSTWERVRDDFGKALFEVALPDSGLAASDASWPDTTVVNTFCVAGQRESKPPSEDIHTLIFFFFFFFVGLPLALALAFTFALPPADFGTTFFGADASFPKDSPCSVVPFAFSTDESGFAVTAASPLLSPTV